MSKSQRSPSFASSTWVDLVAGHSFLLSRAHSKSESHSTHTPVKMGQSNMPLASGHPLPSAPAVSNFISFTSSFTKGLSVYKTLANATLTTSAGTKPQSSDLGLAMKDESSVWGWCSEARVWVMLSSVCRRTGGRERVQRRPRDEDGEDRGLSSGQGWADVVPVWYTLICTLYLSPDCVCEGRWAGTCQMLYGMHRLFINH